jgi:hypothetical protein
MQREPAIQRIRPDDSGRVLDRRRIRRFYLLMLPVLAPVLAIALGGVVLGAMDLEHGDIIGGSLIGFGVLLFIGYCIYETFLIGYYPARCYLQWLRERIDRRPDALVVSDDPDAFFVQIIPREKWTVVMGENASDVGLLVLDKKRDELRYEGDLERWRVPSECVRSFHLRSFTPPGGLPALNEYTVVMLIVELDDRETWETPLACHPIHFEFWTPGKRRRGAELLQGAIGHLVDPDRWPPIDDADLWPLRPPDKRPEVADYG